MSAMSDGGYHVALSDCAATERFAETLAAKVRADGCIALSGPLGSGKTTFARAFIRALSRPDMEVTSPTFTLMQPYDIRLQNGEDALLSHFDLYRVKAQDELEDIGLRDALEQGVTLIEWPEIARTQLPPHTLYLEIQPGKNEDARVIVCKGGAEWYT